MPSSPRCRGGQPANTKAIKHGFYARNLPLKDTAGVADLPLDALADEITLLRIFIRRVAEKSSRTRSLDKSMEHLRVVTFAPPLRGTRRGVTCLSRLMRTQTYIGINPPRENSMQDLLNQAVLEINQEWTARRAASTPPAESSTEDNSQQFTPLELV
jgi:hypothetical protein